MVENDYAVRLFFNKLIKNKNYPATEMNEEHFGKGRRITLKGKLNKSNISFDLGKVILDKFGNVIHYTDLYNSNPVIHSNFCFCPRNSEFAFD